MAKRKLTAAEKRIADLERKLAKQTQETQAQSDRADNAERQPRKKQTLRDIADGQGEGFKQKGGCPLGAIQIAIGPLEQMLIQGAEILRILKQNEAIWIAIRDEGRTISEAEAFTMAMPIRQFTTSAKLGGEMSIAKSLLNEAASQSIPASLMDKRIAEDQEASRLRAEAARS